ncbi:pirin family protein [Fibrisoma limi]|nr:pirin family protein [Fibrisoma limi]
MATNRTLRSINTATPNSVGDGFIGLNAFHPQNSRPYNPFLLLDHHGPMHVQPSEYPRGVDQHPHRGFETVTVLYQGALEHRDSAGNHGKLFAGDVQWMTAASGIVHEEKHEREFSRQGGQLNFVQLWVNLPAKDKMSQPRYQDIASANIPSTTLAGGGQLRVIAGELADLRGPAQTYSPVLLADMTVLASQTETITFPETYNLAVYVLDGQIDLAGSIVNRGQIALTNQDGDSLTISAATDSKLMVLGGEPILEPLAAYGPFVMNTREEIITAFNDFQAGRMGVLV